MLGWLLFLEDGRQWFSESNEEIPAAGYSRKIPVAAKVQASAGKKNKILGFVLVKRVAITVSKMIQQGAEMAAEQVKAIREQAEMIRKLTEITQDLAEMVWEPTDIA